MTTTAEASRRDIGSSPTPSRRAGGSSSRSPRAIAALSRAQVQRLIEDGQGHARRHRRAKPARACAHGDAIEVVVPPPEPLEVVPEPIPLVVLYEDADLIVIDKPAGLVVHPAAGHAQRHAGQRAAAPLRGPVGHRRRAAPGHRPPPRQGHLRRDGRDEVRPRARGADRGVRGQESRRAGRARAHATSRSRRRRRRPRPARCARLYGRHPVAPQEVLVEGRGGKRAVTHSSCVENACPTPRSSSSGSRPAARTRSACTPATTAGRWSAIRSTAASRATRGSPRSRARSAARRCTPRRSRSITRSPASDLAFESPLPADMQARSRRC